MAGTKHYSLWLLLPEEARSRYAALIETLSREHGTPRFEPHITLLGGLQGEEEVLGTLARDLARRLEPFDVRLLDAGYIEEYYRCLFVLVAHSRPLMQAYDEARKQFDRRLELSFMPHLSLMYGLLDEEDKEKILDRIGRYFDDRFRVQELALYAIEGTPEQWRCVVRAPLGGGDAADACL